MCVCLCAQSLSRVRLCNPIDCSPPGSSVHGIFQAGILEAIAISFSRGSSPTQGLNPCLLHLLHWQAASFTTEPQHWPLNLGHVIVLSIPHLLLNDNGNYSTVSECKQSLSTRISLNRALFLWEEKKESFLFKIKNILQENEALTLSHLLSQRSTELWNVLSH